MYAASGGGASTNPGANAGGPSENACSGSSNDGNNVSDVEYEEVNDGKK
jgi:molecular chaperone DnaK